MWRIKSELWYRKVLCPNKRGWMTAGDQALCHELILCLQNCRSFLMQYRLCACQAHGREQGKNVGQNNRRINLARGQVGYIARQCRSTGGHNLYTVCPRCFGPLLQYRQDVGYTLGFKVAKIPVLTSFKKD